MQGCITGGWQGGHLNDNGKDIDVGDLVSNVGGLDTKGVTPTSGAGDCGKGGDSSFTGALGDCDGEGDSSGRGWDAVEPTRGPEIQPMFVIAVGDPQKLGDPVRAFITYTVLTRVSTLPSISFATPDSLP